MSERLARLVWTNFPGGGSRLPVLQAVAEAANEQGKLLSLARAACIGGPDVTKQCLARLEASAKERWIVTDRVLGRGGVLILQINLPKLSRSRREDEEKRSLDGAKRLTRATGCHRTSSASDTR